MKYFATGWQFHWKDGNKPCRWKEKLKRRQVRDIIIIIDSQWSEGNKERERFEMCECVRAVSYD